MAGGSYSSQPRSHQSSQYQNGNFHDGTACHVAAGAVLHADHHSFPVRNEEEPDQGDCLRCEVVRVRAHPHHSNVHVAPLEKVHLGKKQLELGRDILKSRLLVV